MPETSGRRTQRERRDAAEDALLTAAARLIVEEGPAALTLARVGEDAGYSRGIASHHFGTKHALLDALVRRAQSGFVPGLSDRRPGLDRLLAFVDGYVRRLGDDDVRARAFLVLWGAASTTGELADLFRERDVALRSDLHDDLTAGLAEGAIRPDVDPDGVALALSVQMRALGLQLPREATRPDVGRLATTVTDAWRRALAAEV